MPRTRSDSERQAKAVYQRKNYGSVPPPGRLRAIGRRCPECGALVELPCRECAVRAEVARQRLVARVVGEARGARSEREAT